MTLPVPVAAFLVDLLACLRFYSRLPLPAFAFEKSPFGMPDFSRIARALPVAGALLGAIGATILMAALGLGLPPSIASALAVVALLAATGVFHEDGLADTADGFGGGATIPRKLEIMKDSRIGSYGAAALTLALLLRWTAITTLATQTGWVAAVAIVAAAAVSRAAGLMPLATLPPARIDGAAASAGTPSGVNLAIACCLAALLGLLPAIAGFVSSGRNILALGLVVAAAAATTWLSWRQIRGQTGDVAGAAQQAAEIVFLLTLSAAP